MSNLRNYRGRITAEHTYHDEVFTYVDEDGVARISAPAHTHIARSIAQADAYRGMREREEFRGKQSAFTFSNMEALQEVISALTTTQCGYLLVLQCYISFDNGRLTNPDRSYMSTSDMMTVLQLGRKRQTFYDFFAACTEHDVIIANEDGSYSVNVRYHFKGATDNPFVIRSYSAKIRQVYREAKAVDLGLIYRMLPYVHYETNALCANPDERNPANIRWFNRKELAQAIGVSEGEISRRLPRITLGNEYVIAKVSVGGHPPRYMLNPFVFYRKTSEPDTTAQAMFNVKVGGK
ncbi:hypothetical protein [Brevibacillus porteri]|uniref:hypothetical protein n=1 Tax=Brevibacillus porteri TaxID=2126350 RepID=UPI003D1DB3E1